MLTYKQHRSRSLLARALVMAAAAASAHGEDMLVDTAKIPVTVNVEAAVSIRPPAESTTGVGDEKIIGAGATDTLILLLNKNKGNSSIYNRIHRRTDPAPATVSRVRGNIHINLSRQSYDNAVVSLYSIDGKLILRGKADAAKDIHHISRPNIAGGVYLLSVKGINSSVFTARLIHPGKRLDLNVTFDDDVSSIPIRKSSNTANAYGEWTLSVKPTTGGGDTSYTFPPVKGINPAQVITINQNVTRLIPAGLGFAKNSVNAVAFRQNSIVTHKDTQYIAYYADNTALRQSPVMIGKRALGDASFELTNTGILGWSDNAHNSVSIMVDGDGYIHAAVNHHNKALEYYRGSTPGGFDLTKRAMVGTDETSVTYVEFYRLPSGDLIFVYRNGGSGDGYMVMNKYSAASKTWSRVHDRVLDGKASNPSVSPYWMFYVDAAGTLHLAWVFRETPDVATNYGMFYAYSADEGKTWRKKSNGSAYALPIVPATAERILTVNQNNNLMNQTNMTADQSGNPYISTYYGRPTIQYRVIYHDGTQWRESQVSNRTRDDGFVLSGGGTMQVPVARPRMVARRNAATGKTEAHYIVREVERGSVVTMYSTKDISSNVWTAKNLTDFSVNLWEPSHDTELWKRHGKLHIFVQYTEGLADGSLLTDSSAPPSMVYCLEATNVI